MLAHSKANVNTCMIIAAAMIMGMVLFCAVLFVLTRNQPATEGPLVLSVIMAGGSAVAFLAAAIVPAIITTAKRKQLQNSGKPATSQELLDFYQTRLIITLGILESAVVMNMVAYLIEQQTWSLMIAAGLVLVMVIHFPTPGRIEHWIKEQTELLTLEN